MVVPLGFYFQPKDEDLIQYLKNKIEGVPVDPLIVRDFDVYSTEPWNFPKNQFPYQREETEMYFFSQRRHSGTGSRVKRTAGSGHWHGYGSDKPITMPSGEVVGHKTTNLSFLTAQRDITHWVMDEYRLHDEQFHHTVLCKIRMSARGKCKLKRKADAVQHSPLQSLPPRKTSTAPCDQLPEAAVMLQQQDPERPIAEESDPHDAEAVIQKLLHELEKQKQHKSSYTAKIYQQLPESELPFRHQQQQQEGSNANSNSALYGYCQQQRMNLVSVMEQSHDAQALYPHHIDSTPSTSQQQQRQEPDAAGFYRLPECDTSLYDQTRILRARQSAYCRQQQQLHR